jgi:hypothetical protein
MCRSTMVFLGAILLTVIPTILNADDSPRTVVAAIPVGRSSTTQIRAFHQGVSVAVTCSSRDGSRVCQCESKCHRTEEDCECEDDN